MACDPQCAKNPQFATELSEVTERRLVLTGGLELDVAIGTSDWANTDPVDDGTRRVVAGGMRILHDPDGR